MRRTQIYLDADQSEQLGRRARSSGVSKSTVIREAIASYLSSPDESAMSPARFRAALNAASERPVDLPDGAGYVEAIRAADAERDEELETRRGRPKKAQASVSVLLDTSIVIDVLRGAEPALEYARGLTEPPTCSEITRVEILRGVRSDERRTTERLLEHDPMGAHRRVDRPAGRRAGSTLPSESPRAGGDGRPDHRRERARAGP